MKGRHTIAGLVSNMSAPSARSRIENETWDIVDESSWESFPASDPPAWIAQKPKTRRLTQTDSAASR